MRRRHTRGQGQVSPCGHTTVLEEREEPRAACAGAPGFPVRIERREGGAMSEGLIGVLIGGAIGLLGTGIAAFLDYVKWSKDRKYNHLVRKREQMEATFQKVRSTFPKNL